MVVETWQLKPQEVRVVELTVENVDEIIELSRGELELIKDADKYFYFGRSQLRTIPMGWYFVLGRGGFWTMPLEDLEAEYTKVHGHP